MSRKQKKMLIRIIICAGMLAALLLTAPEGIARLVLFAAAYLVIGYDILYKAFRGIRNGRVFDENFLMAIATLGAFALAIYEKSGDYTEAIAVMLFYQVGELFQSIAVGKSRRNITALMDIRPDYANIERNGILEQEDPEDIVPGTVIVVQPGERVPIDGIVEDGESVLDTSALTGESVPRHASAGSEIISGCVNLTGVLKIRTTKPFGESTVSRILELVEDSGSHKARSEQFISRFARIYTPAVCIGALACALLPPLIRLIAGADPQWNVWVYRALTFLVISCPCALVISIPLTFFAGIGGAGRAGILVKGSNCLEALADTGVMVFDKTGTLTKGTFEVRHVHHSPYTDAQLIEYAALAECASSHPISISLRNACGKEPDRSRVAQIEEISGQGVIAMVDGKQVAAGNYRLMQKLGIPWVDCKSPGTIVHVGIDGDYAGHIVISDCMKEDSARAVRELKQAGVEKTVMLTGDISSTAQQAAQELGIDEVRSELMPGEKVAAVEELLEEIKKKENRRDGSRKKKLAFAGDGMNDAPVLMRSDIGIAMGAMGSDAAIEAADVVLMDDDPLKVVKAIYIARKCIRIVYENIVFALLVKVVCLVLGAMGIADMWYAIFADVGVMVIAVLNAMRALTGTRKQLT